MSHHAIMGLVEPFSRRGHRVDLPASDRAQGVLVFRPVEIPAAPDGHPALTSVLRLERPHRLKVRIIRTLKAADGRRATVIAEGDDPDRLLDAIEAVPPARSFHVVEADGGSPGAAAAGRLVTRCYRIEAWRTPPSRRGLLPSGALPRALRPDRCPEPRLTAAELHVGSLRLSATDTPGRALEVRLTTIDGEPLALPSDFLAVLGWSWRPLRRVDRSTWVGSVRPFGRASERTARLEAALDRAAAHLVETLAAPPDAFHRRHHGARWRAAFQRSLPLLFVVGMTVGIASAVHWLPKTPVVHMLMLHTSILAIAALKMMDKAWRVEIPPPPRPSARPRWVGI